MALDKDLRCIVLLSEKAAAFDVHFNMHPTVFISVLEQKNTIIIMIIIIMIS